VSIVFLPKLIEKFSGPPSTQHKRLLRSRQARKSLQWPHAGTSDFRLFRSERIACRTAVNDPTSLG
jgi:hypothetical protein